MASKDPARPNVLVIVSDDQGPWALGAAGNREIITPRLDELALEGVRFSNFFCTSPVCSPARASIYTGRMPSQHGVHDHVRPAGGDLDAVDFIQGMVTYNESLNGIGYIGGLSGKWHLGESVKPRPGFEHWYALLGGMSDYNHAPMFRDGQLVEEHGYLTDLIADDASRFIESSALDDRPFCLNVAFTAPHSPWIDQHPDEYTALYRDCEFESCPQRPAHPWGPSSLHPQMVAAAANPRPNLIGYFAAVTAMDSAIGRLLDSVRRHDLWQSTLIVFVSDNGFNCGHHGIWGKGNATFPQNVFEESVKVPAIVSLPGTIAGNRVMAELTSGYDLFPTIIDYCGAERRSEEGVIPPGRSLRDLLSGAGGDPRDFVVVFSEYGPVRMIRTVEWKLVRRYPYGPDELYDMVNDPGEEVNLVDEPSSARVVRELQFELEAWFETHSIPWADGSRSPVTGAGQRGLAGSRGRGLPAFYPPVSAALPREDFRRLPIREE